MNEAEGRGGPLRKYTIHDLFRMVQQHPHFIGGTIFTKADIPEGRVLPAHQKDLTPTLVQAGNEYLEDVCVPEGASE